MPSSFHPTPGATPPPGRAIATCARPIAVSTPSSTRPGPDRCGEEGHRGVGGGVVEHPRVPRDAELSVHLGAPATRPRPRGPLGQHGSPTSGSTSVALRSPASTDAAVPRVTERSTSSQ